MPKRHTILPVKDVNQQVLIRKLGKYLKQSGKIEVPDWVECVKTGISRELPPQNQDWIYYRVASIARRVYMRCPSGVGALCRRYGGRNGRKGVVPEHTSRGSKKIIRHSLQQLEKMGWMKKAYKGRKLTTQGRRFLEDFSVRAHRSKMVNHYWKQRSKTERKNKKQAKLKSERKQGGATQGATQGQEDQTYASHQATRQEQVEENFDY